MASGYITGTTTNKYITVQINWSSVANIDANTSTVTVTAYARKSSKANEATDSRGTWYLSIAGQATTISKRVTLEANNSWVYMGARTSTIAHNDDGTKSVAIGLSGGMTASGVTWTATYCSSIITLDAIPRETKPSFSTTELDIGSSLEITLNPASNENTHLVSYVWQENTYPIEYDSTAEYPQTISWTIPQTFIDDLSNSTSSTCSIVVETFKSDGSSLGINTTPIIVNVPSNIVPTIHNILCTDVNPETAALNTFIIGRSLLHVKAYASPGQGAKITNYTISALNSTRTTNDVDIGIVNSSSINVSVTITDSRGRTATSTKILTGIEYSPPEISLISCSRARADGTLDDGATYASVQLSYSVFFKIQDPIDDLMTLNIYYTDIDTEENILIKTISSKKAEVLESYLIGTFNPEHSYTLKFEVVDLLFNFATYIEAILPTESGNIIAWTEGGKGIAFGKAIEEDDYADFGWKIKAREGIILNKALSLESEIEAELNEIKKETLENLGAAPISHTHQVTDIVGTDPTINIIDLIYPIGSIYISANSVNPGILFKGEWIQIKDSFLLSAGDTYIAGETGGEANHVLTVDEMPNHTHSWYRYAANGTSTFWGPQSANTTQITIQTGGTGGDMPHNNMPPYLVVYIWQRIA